MFDRLSSGLTAVFERLGRKGALTEEDVTAALREIRIALLEADVSLDVAKQFIQDVTANIVGEKIVRSVSPAQMVVKLVHDELTKALGGEGSVWELHAKPPAVILLVGLQGAGKTASAAKLALWLKKKKKKRCLLASLDIYRPAAREQLAILARQTEQDSLPIVENETPEHITIRALKAAAEGEHDVVILDTAGRMQIDENMMQELAVVKQRAKPDYTFLVADAMTGQEAVNVAKRFGADDIGFDGMILTRADGDASGGAALSMKYATGKTIYFAGTGEHPEAFEAFRPERTAGKILGMGDIVSFVEQAVEQVGEEDMSQMQSLRSGRFTLEDMQSQFNMMRKMGGVSGLMKFLPNLPGMKTEEVDAEAKEKDLKRMDAIIKAMTPKERRRLEIINASRKKRIAAGSGTPVSEVNKLLKMHKQMAGVMKKLSGISPKELLRGSGGGLPKLPKKRGF